MQLNSAENCDPIDSDDIDETLLDDAENLELDSLSITEDVPTTRKELLARRRRAEDMLEARRLREELGDDEFIF